MINTDVEKDIKETIKKSPIGSDSRHAELVLKWVLKLKPDADEALQIAALSHDIDRGVTGITESDLKDYSKIDEFKREHALRSAQFVGEILEKHQYPPEVIAKVKDLVGKHEVGGAGEADILKDADSIAYFEYNIPLYLERNGEERTRKKIRFMYSRMSGKAKEFVPTLQYDDPVIENLVKEAVSEDSHHE